MRWRYPISRRHRPGGAMHGNVDFRAEWCYAHTFNAGSCGMRSTIDLDDNIIERARALTGTTDTVVLVRQALETLVRVESGKRLVALGGSMPDAQAAPRRQSDTAE